MRKVIPLAVVTLNIGLSPSAADAFIQAAITPAPHFLSGNTTNIDATLAANGWAAYLLVLTSDAAPITTVELKNDLFQLGGTIGINAILHQDSKISSDDGITRIGTASAATGLTASATQGGRDSVFLNSGYYFGVPNPFTEDNNKINSANPPYIGSPLTDSQAEPNASPPVAGNDWGVGSLMTFTGAAPLASASTTLQVAYLIVPANGSGPNLIRGYAIDSNGIASFFSVGFVLPEPSSLLTLGFGALCLLKRRRWC